MCLKLYKLITSLFKVASSRQPVKPGRFKLAGSCATDKALSTVPFHQEDTEQAVKQIVGLRHLPIGIDIFLAPSFCLLYAKPF